MALCAATLAFARGGSSASTLLQHDPQQARATAKRRPADSPGVARNLGVGSALTMGGGTNVPSSLRRLLPPVAAIVLLGATIFRAWFGQFPTPPAMLGGVILTGILALAVDAAARAARRSRAP